MSYPILNGIKLEFLSGRVIKHAQFNRDETNLILVTEDQKICCIEAVALFGGEVELREAKLTDILAYTRNSKDKELLVGAGVVNMEYFTERDEAEKKQIYSNLEASERREYERLKKKFEDPL